MHTSKHLIVITTLIFSAVTGSPANPQSSAGAAKPLRVDQTVSGKLQPGETQSYEFALNAGDYMQAMVDQTAGQVDVVVYDPTGQMIKTTARQGIMSPDGKIMRVETSELKPVDVLALRDGKYRLELQPDGSQPAAYDISYSEHRTMDERMKMAPVYHPDQSPQIIALQKELQKGNSGALNAFGAQIRKEGSPLVELISDDSKHVLATLLWYDTQGVKNIGLAWEPYTTMNPERYMFTQLLDTKLWYLTLRLPSDVRFLYQLCPDDDMIPYDKFDVFDNNARERHEACLMPDPLNPHHWVQQNGDFSLLELPGTPAQPWVAKRADVPEGKLVRDRFKSTLLNNDREIAIYTPSGYSKSHTPYPITLIFDEEAYITFVPTPTILDNLIAAKKIPPMVMVFMSSLNRDARRSETMGAQTNEYRDAVAKELVPWIRKNYNVTTDPAHTIIGGSSANGFTSVYIAWFYPNLFGNVLCQSGALSWAPGFNIAAGGAYVIDNPDWLAQQLATNPKKSIRYFVEAGLFEDNRGGILDSSRHFRDVAIAKGYDIKYQEFASGHNYINWRGSIADGLIYLTNPLAKSSKK